MNLGFREYENKDYEVVRELLIESFPEVHDLLVDGLTSSEALDLDKKVYLQVVALVDDKIVGYTLASRTYDPIMRRKNIWIDYVCVNPEYRGQGIARKFLQRVEDIAKEEKVLFLQLTSSRFRTGARKLYQDFGFEIRESDIFRKVLE